MIRLKTFIISTCLIFTIVFSVQPQENIGSTSQPLVGGATVDQQTRRELGLLTLFTPTGSCSASLLNDHWAITASHCIDDVASPDQVTLEAKWTAIKTETRKVAKIKSFQWTHNLDIALLMIVFPFPRHPSVKYPELSYRPTSDLMEQRIELFGRGINTLAWQAGSNPMPTQSDGLFRTSEFIVFEIGESYYKYRSVEGAGSAIAGGDSGGPSYFRVWDDPNHPNRQIVRLLAGVHANCRAQCLPGQSCTDADPWTWVTNIPECTDASIQPIASIIRTQIAFVPEGPFKEKQDIDPAVIVAKPDIAVTAPSPAMKELIRNQSTLEIKPRPNIKSILAALSPNFTGTWSTVTTAGSNYTIILRQNGTTVDGTYTSPVGALKGNISGTVSDRTLIYRWSQEDGQKGSGKFVLSEDGGKFEGSWGYSDDPNVAEGTWNGTRQ